MQLRNKKIAFFLPSFNIGGIERVFISLANNMLPYCQVSFIVCVNNGELRRLLDKHVAIYGLGNIRLRSSLWRLVKIMKCEKFDYVISGGDFPNIILILSSFFVSKTQCIISQHNYSYYKNEIHVLKYKLVLFLVRKLYPFASKTIAVSSGIKEYLVNEIGIPEEKIILLPNAVDVNKIRQDSLQKTNEINFEYVVFVGRLSKVKNLSMLLEAFNLYNKSNIYLLIIGDGEDRAMLEMQARKSANNKKIIFLGQVSNPMPYIRNARALVSASFSESFGMTFLEALALNVPVLTTPTKGALEVLGDTDMAVFSNSFTDAKDYAINLDKVLSISHKDCSMYLSKYSIENSAKQLWADLCKLE